MNLDFDADEVAEFSSTAYRDSDWEKYNESMFKDVLEWLSKLKNVKKPKVAIVFINFVGFEVIKYMPLEQIKGFLYLKKDDKYLQIDLSQRLGTAIETDVIPKKYFIIDFERDMQRGTETNITVGYKKKRKIKIFK